MGYMLMISHDQYKQYQERMIKVQNKPVHTMPISKLRNEGEYDKTHKYLTVKKHESVKYRDSQRASIKIAKIEEISRH